MIRSRLPRPATSPSPRRLPLSPFSHTSRPTLCASPLPASPNSTHPTQLDTPVSPQPLCYQSNAHTFRHTWGCPSVSTFNSELSTSHHPFHTCPRQRPYQCHSAPLSRPLFSYSYALFCTARSAISHLFISLRTLCAKHRGWRMPHSPNSHNLEPPNLPKLACAQVAAPIIAAPLKNSWFETKDDLSSLQDLGRFASVGRLRSWMTQRAFGFRPRRDHSSNLSRVCKGLLP
jgi:hypothetical protein